MQRGRKGEGEGSGEEGSRKTTYACTGMEATARIGELRKVAQWYAVYAFIAQSFCRIQIKYLFTLTLFCAYIITF